MPSVLILCWRRAFGALFLLAALAGCTGKPAGTVSGVVKYRGAPVTSGTVHLYAPDRGIGASAALDGSGAFRLPEPIGVGSYKVYIQPPPPQQLPPGSPMQKTTLDIPQVYQDAGSTTLSREVKAGRNEFPIELTD